MKSIINWILGRKSLDVNKLQKEQEDFKAKQVYEKNRLVRLLGLEDYCRILDTVDNKLSKCFASYGDYVKLKELVTAQQKLLKEHHEALQDVLNSVAKVKKNKSLLFFSFIKNLKKIKKNIK